MYSARYSCTILMKLKLPRLIFEIYSNFMKIRPVGAELFRADGRTKLIVAFHNFADAPSKVKGTTDFC